MSMHTVVLVLALGFITCGLTQNTAELAGDYAEVTGYLAQVAKGNIDLDQGLKLLAKYTGNGCLTEESMKSTTADFMAAKTPEDKVKVMIKHQTCYQKVLKFITEAAAKAGVSLNAGAVSAAGGN